MPKTSISSTFVATSSNFVVLHSSHEASSPYRRVVPFLLGILLGAVEGLDDVAVLVALGAALLVFHLPAHEVAAEREQGEVDGDPGEEDAEVEADARVQVEQDLARGLDDVV